MADAHVLIAGGGIAGLSLGLTLHQIGVPFTIFDRVRALRPLGVGINIQPNAVRELFDLGLTAEALDTVGIPAREWALLGRNGREIHAEPRGTVAGYNWPQYAMHRGKFHMLLAQELVARAGPDCLQLDSAAEGFDQTDTGVTLHLAAQSGARRSVQGTVLIGADGIHSAIRAQIHPHQGPIHWGGTLMWRGTSDMRPLRSGSSFVGLGTSAQRMVIYPITPPDPETGRAQTNWIAEITVPDPGVHALNTWFRQTDVSDVLPHFQGWSYDWLNVPDLIRSAGVAYENPMIDRDPVPTWVEGRVALMGDAAHAMYPTGSNGASQAIIDAREIGAAFLAHGVSMAALTAYDAKLCGPISEVVLRNRGAGPFGLLDMVEKRCGGDFTDIEDVVPEPERAAFLSDYKSAAGFAMHQLNTAPPIIPKGARATLPLS